MLSGDGRDAWYRYLRHLSRHRGLLHTHPLLQVHVQTLQFENPLLEQTKNPGGVGNTGFFFMYRRPTLYPLEIAVDFLKSL